MKNILILILIFILLFSGCKKDNSVNKKITSEPNKVLKKQQKDYSKTGLEIAFGTKKQLGKNLIGQLSKNGTQKAIEFCNLKALPLTDSMQTVYQARIKRVSNKNRNPNNKANRQEEEYINQFKTVLKRGEKPQPVIQKTQDSVYFYYPIITNAMCLQCHGKPNQDIKPETLKLISSLYPEDKATGYTENQVRGIWNIAFKK